MKTLNQYIKESLLDDEDDLVNNDDSVIIEQFLKDNYKITGTYTINKNKEVNVDGDVKLLSTNVKYLTNNLFSFGEVTGSFDCGESSILSLKGSPKVVRKVFKCNYCNNLKNLEGSPKDVGGFVCSYCQSLKTIKGVPEIIKGPFLCAKCDSLESLEGSPKVIEGWVNCSWNKSLKSLDGFVSKVYSHVYCDECDNLIKLECSKLSVGGDFTCHNCENLSSLEGFPKYIGGHFSFRGCFRVENLTPLKSANVKKHIYGADGNCIYPNKLK